MITPEDIHSHAVLLAIAVAVPAAVGEWLHARRIARIGALAFGPKGRPRLWTRAVPALRTAAIAAAVWSLATLCGFDRKTRDRTSNDVPERHLMVLLDVSPSMLLKDAGEGAQSTRGARASEVLRSVLDRAPGDHLRFSAAGFYTEARMLVEECRDRELILHLAGGTPFHITYRPGKTDILGSINQIGAFAKRWPRKSATLLVLSDGDSLAPTGLNPLPSAFSDVIIAGVGDTSRGIFIDGHLSRQDGANLSQLARRLGGRYYDCNVRHIPGEALERINQTDASSAKWRFDRRLTALAVLGASSSLLCLLPLLLEAFGSAWRPVTVRAPAPIPQPV